MKVIVINSAKGGVGKTRTAKELALELVKRGRTVSVMDLDVTTPNVKAIEGIEVYSSTTRQMPNKTTIKRFIRKSFEKADTDFMIIDTPPTISEMYLSISSYLRNAEFFFVTTRDENSVKDTGVGMRFFALYGIDVSKVILNMSDMFNGLSDEDIESELGVEIIANLTKNASLDKLAAYADEMVTSMFKLNNITHNPLLSKLSKLTVQEVEADENIPLRFYNLETWEIIRERIMEKEFFDTYLNVSAEEIEPYLEYEEDDLIHVRVRREVSVAEKFLPFEIIKCYVTMENKVARGLPMLVTPKGTHLWISEVNIVSDREISDIVDDGGIDTGESIFLDFFNQMYMFRVFTRFELVDERRVIELYEEKTKILVSDKDKIFTIAILENDVKPDDHENFVIQDYIDQQEDDFKEHLKLIIGVN